MSVRSLVLLSLLAACASGEESDLATVDRAAAANLVPWQHDEKWPFKLDTSSRMVIHYQEAGDLGMAQSVLTDLEEAWRIQIGEQGALAPLDDLAEAGDDGRFDVYLWRGIDTLYVDSVKDNLATWWDDWSTFMVLDPWGKYGGAEMRPNIFHELRHATQSVDDWWEHITFFESEATMWEVAQHGYPRLSYVWADYQSRPNWTPFRDDQYRTWYMYGGALYFLYLRDAVFGGGLGFSNELWRRCRNAPGAETDPTKNDPDFVDALEQMLSAKGTHFFDSIVGFARARWYTGARANGTVRGWDAVPEVLSGAHVRKSGARRTSFNVGPQLLGSVYTVVEKAPTDGATLRVTLSNLDVSARPVVQVVGQGTADRVVANGGTVSFKDGKVVLVVTMLPSNGQYDPDTVNTQTYRGTVNLDKP